MTDGINQFARAEIGRNKINLSTVDELHLTIGQKIAVQVIAREGELYLLRLGSASFLAKTDAALTIGERVELVVEGSRENIVLLQETTSENQKPDDSSSDKPMRIVFEKYGVTGGREMNILTSMTNLLPLQENAAVRSLLDPNLAVMLLLPEPAKQGCYQKVEIRRYPGNRTRPEDYWEVIIALEPENLGRLEIYVLLTTQGLSARIWAEEEATEALLRGRCSELDGIFNAAEIVPAADGPMLNENEQEFIDVWR